MFRPGDIVTLEEPDDGDEKVVIFICYTKLYGNEVDCVLIEKYGREKDSAFRYYIGYSDDYKLFPNTGLYTKDEIEFAKMLTSMKCDITYGTTTFYNECAIISSSATFDGLLSKMKDMIENVHNPSEIQKIIDFTITATAPTTTAADKVVFYQ